MFLLCDVYELYTRRRQVTTNPPHLHSPRRYQEAGTIPPDFQLSSGKSGGSIVQSIEPVVESEQGSRQSLLGPTEIEEICADQ